MPYEQMNERQVAAYLGIDLREVIRYAARGTIPARKVGDEKFVFRKNDLDHWVWVEMHSFDRKKLAGIERGVFAYHGLAADEPIVCPLVPENGFVIPMSAKTRESALRTLVEQAEKMDLVYDRDELLSEMKGREQLCSTALLPEVAFPHPRQPLPYDIAKSFIIVGKTDKGVPFGAENGGLTRLFFMVCCKDDRTHLHVLARLVRILDDTPTMAAMLEAETSEDFANTLAHREMEVLRSII